MSKSCIIPECQGAAPGRARFCLDCTTAVSAELRGEIVRLEKACDGTRVQSDYVRIRARLAAKVATAWAICQRRREWMLAKAKGRRDGAR